MFEVLRTERGWWKHHEEVYALLGITGGKLPAEGFYATVGDVRFLCLPANYSPNSPINPFTGKPKRWCSHRLYVRCPCGKDVPFGRMNQHVKGRFHFENLPSKE